MMSSHFTAAVASQRQSRYLPEAESFRRGQAAPTARLVSPGLAIPKPIAPVGLIPTRPVQWVSAGWGGR
jgi:hypothetical protein